MEKRTLTLTKKRLPLVATLTATALFIVVGVGLNATYLFSADAEVARREGYEVRPYFDAVQLQRRAERREEASEADLGRLRQLIADRNEFIRARAVSAVNHFGKRSRREECLQLLQERLVDPSEMVRAAALRGIWRIDRKVGERLAMQMTTIGENERAVRESILEGSKGK